MPLGSRTGREKETWGWGGDFRRVRDSGLLLGLGGDLGDLRQAGTWKRSLTSAGSLTLSHTQNCYCKFRLTTRRVLGTGLGVIFLKQHLP